MHNVIAILLVVAGSVVFANIALPISQDKVIPQIEEWEFPNSGSVEMEMDDSGHPVRPKFFQTPFQIKDYLKIMGKAYSVRKSARFGKRREQAFKTELKYNARDHLTPLVKNDN